MPAMGSFFSIDNLQHLKWIVHYIQAFFIFVAWCVMIGYFRNADFVAGSAAWYFALCFISIPPLLYQTLTTRFPHSRKFSHPYAHTSIDLLMCILWLSAFASVASMNTAGLCNPACNLSKACVGLGFFIWLFWGLTAAMAVYGVLYWRREGRLPGAAGTGYGAGGGAGGGYGAGGNGYGGGVGGGAVESAGMDAFDPDRDAFSTTLPGQGHEHEHDEEGAYAPVGMHEHDEDHSHAHHGVEGSYDPVSYDGFGSRSSRHGGAVGLAGAMGGNHLGYVPPSAVSDVDTSYGGAALPSYSYAPSAAATTGHGGDDEDGRVRFPAGNYHS